MVKAVLLLLLMFSVASWAIIFFKWRYLRTAERQTASFMRSMRTLKEPEGIFGLARRHNLSPVSNVLAALYGESRGKGLEDTRRLSKRYESIETEKLERHLGFLATTGSVSPFIGLFGTVWGIMNSFRGIGASGNASLAVVAPGIAEALIATAMGLAAAIPAVMAYNYFVGRVRRLAIQTEDFSEEAIELFAEKADKE